MLICTGNVREKVDAARVALSPDGRTVAIAIENNITIYNGITQEEDEQIKTIFSSMLKSITF